MVKCRYGRYDYLRKLGAATPGETDRGEVMPMPKPVVPKPTQRLFTLADIMIVVAEFRGHHTQLRRDWSLLDLGQAA